MLTTADWADWTWQTGVNRADRRRGLTDLTSDQATESFSFFSHLNFTTISCHYNGYRRFCHRKWKRVDGSENFIYQGYVSNRVDPRVLCFIDHVIFLNWGRSPPYYASTNCCMLFHLCHSLHCSSLFGKIPKKEFLHLRVRWYLFLNWSHYFGLTLTFCIPCVIYKIPF